MEKLKISGFVKFLEKQAGAGGEVPAGYIMGSTGQVLTQKLLENFARWQRDYSINDYIKYGSRWLGRRVFDCNGLAEGYYEEMTGVDIDSKARFNYSQWCEGYNGKNMSDLPQVPGTAVFMYSAARGYITHVGFLWRFRDGDWDVIEARGVKYGVVVTKYSKRSWNRWGQMMKYFDYSDVVIPIPPPDPTPIPEKLDRILSLQKPMMKGDDVKALQSMLLDNGYFLGSWGADGVFGTVTYDAVVAFQKDNGLTQNGIVDQPVWDVLLKVTNTVPDPGIPSEETRALSFRSPMMVGNDVKALQNKLHERGYDLGSWGIDGIFGKVTHKAVLAFQKDNGLAQNGVVDDTVWHLLLKDAEPETDSDIPPELSRILSMKTPNMSGEDVVQLQTRLIETGYNLNKWGADGIFGNETYEAVIAFQKEEGLKVDGIVGQKTWTALWS